MAGGTPGATAGDLNGPREHECCKKGEQTGHGNQPRHGMVWHFAQESTLGGTCTLLVCPQPREVLQISAKTVGTHLRTSVPKEKTPGKSDISTHMDLDRKDTSSWQLAASAYTLLLM